MKKKIILFIICIAALLTLSSSTAAHSSEIESVNVNIDANIFNTNQIRLNTEIYDIAESIVNYEHISKRYNLNSTIAKTASRMYTPLIPITLTAMETGSWADRSITWSSAIYSKLLPSNIEIDTLSIDYVDEAFYNMLGLKSYLYCGSGCTSYLHSKGLYGHTGTGNNDNDSIGPLQILRRYIQQKNGFESYTCCNKSVYDLMRWEDSVSYLFHNNGGAIFNTTNAGKNNTIDNVYELVALIGVAHNTGPSFLETNYNSGYTGSYWNSPSAIFKLAEDITSDVQLDVFKAYVDNWWNTNKYIMSTGDSFSLAGEIFDSVIDSLLAKGGIDLYDYCSSKGHKQYYPIKAILNYMSYERLYTSGGNKDK